MIVTTTKLYAPFRPKVERNVIIEIPSTVHGRWYLQQLRKLASRYERRLIAEQKEQQQ
jgi:hypothetical protein